MTWNSMGHVGLEADYFVTKEMLSSMADAWHYGWRWKGNEDCLHCELEPCGLISKRSNNCPEHGNKREGSSKQLHKAHDCPATKD